MSRRIDPDRPYTEEDKKWLLTRAKGKALIAVNDRRFAHLSDEERAALTGRVDDDNAKEQELQDAALREMEEEEEDSYHPDDVEKVSHLTIAQLRAALEEEGLSPTVSERDKKGDGGSPLTEKEVLTYRLLNRLDDKRNAAQV